MNHSMISLRSEAVYSVTFPFQEYFKINSKVKSKIDLDKITGNSRLQEFARTLSISIPN